MHKHLCKRRAYLVSLCSCKIMSKKSWEENRDTQYLLHGISYLAVFCRAASSAAFSLESLVTWATCSSIYASTSNPSMVVPYSCFGCKLLVLSFVVLCVYDFVVACGLCLFRTLVGTTSHCFLLEISEDDFSCFVIFACRRRATSFSVPFSLLPLHLPYKPLSFLRKTEENDRRLNILNY